MAHRTSASELAEIVCGHCGHAYHYDQHRHCWFCDGPFCPYCLDESPRPLCPQCRQERLEPPEPMLAVAGTMPAHAREWAFEFKWDGLRALCSWDGQSLRLTSRAGHGITGRYPELAGLGEALGPHTAVLDGEIVALDRMNRPSFPLLQKRMHLSPQKAPQAALTVPVQYYLFDVLYLDGHWLMDRPYSERRQFLSALKPAHPNVRIPPSHPGAGAAMLRTAREVGLEGLVAKRLTSRYEPGHRSADWVKIKLVRRQEFVVGGWTARAGSPRRIAALLLGVYDDGGLRFAGRVGTGFDEDDHRLLLERLERLERPLCPFVDKPPDAGAHWVAPQLVAEVAYRRWPPGQVLHQASYLGLLDDRPADQVRREEGA